MAVHSVAAGAPIYASDINALVTALTPQVTTTAATIGTVASGFTISAVRGATMSDGRLVHVDLFLTVTASISTGGTGVPSNIADTTVFTLAAAYRPSNAVQCCYDVSGSTAGFATINTDGTVVVRSTNVYAFSTVAITSGQNLRITAVYELG
jgi:hypothetical protein